MVSVILGCFITLCVLGFKSPVCLVLISYLLVKSGMKCHDRQLRLSHDWMNAYIVGISILRLHHLITAEQTLASNTQYGRVIIHNIFGFKSRYWEKMEVSCTSIYTVYSICSKVKHKDDWW